MANTPQLNHRTLRQSAPQSGAAPNQFDPWILWVTFRRCWAWAVPVGAVFAGIAAYWTLYNFVPMYRASHLLEANQDYVLHKGVMPTVDDFVRSEKSLFTNPIVLDPVLSDPAVLKALRLTDPETAESNLRKNLKISSGGTRSRLVVSFDDTDPVAAAMVCNAVVDSYRRQRDSFDNIRMSNLEHWLQPEILRLQGEVEERQRKVFALSEQTLGYSRGQRAEMLEVQADESFMTLLRSQITDLKVELAVFDAQLAMKGDLNQSSDADANGDAESPNIVIERREPTESEIAAAINGDQIVVEAQALVARYKSTLLNMEDGDLVRLNRDYYRETQAKRDEAMAKLEKAKEGARERVIAQLNQLADDYVNRATIEAKQQIADQALQFDADHALSRKEIRRKRQDMVTKLAVLQTQYDEERTRLEEFGGVSAELQFAQDSLLVSNEMLQKLRARVAAIQTERIQDSSVRTMAKATPPKSPVEKVPTKKLAVASGAAFMIPFLIGLLWELKVQRVTDCAAVEKISALAPVVGEVARLPAGTGSGRTRRMFEESVDSLRSNLFLAVETKDTRSIAVVSSMSAEGKSSVASQLALSVAKATGNTVLLVDADLRCPDQHDIFGLKMGKGLCGVLSKDATFEEAVDTSLGDLIHVLPAGRPGHSPHRLMSETSMRKFVERALEDYSVVVIDTAPVLAAGETLAISAVVDATLLCVMRDVSRMDNVTRTTRRLEAAGAKIAGTVFSGVTPREYAYRYGDYHYAIAASEA